MKTFRLFGLALMAVLLSFGFASCSDDDDPIENIKEVEGTWILVQEKYWDSEDGDYSQKHDFNEPDNDSEKLVIKKTGENYELIHYGYSESQEDWYLDSKEIVKLDGNKIVYVGEDALDYEDTKMEIASLTSDKLVIKGSYAEEGYKETMELTYQKK